MPQRVADTSAETRGVYVSRGKGRIRPQKEGADTSAEGRGGYVSRGKGRIPVVNGMAISDWPRREDNYTNKQKWWWGGRSQLIIN